MKTVIIADQQPITAKGITSVIKKDKEAYSIAHVAKSNEELTKLLNMSYPDVLILDIDLPDFGGFAALKTLKSRNPKTRILVFSQQAEELYALSAIRAGASGYLGKSSSLKKFKKALDQVARGGIYVSKKVNKMISSKSRANNSNVINKYRKLSSRETEVLDLISKGKRNKDIAEILNINEKTVSTYKTRLYKKLNVDNIAGLIQQSNMLVLD